MVITNTSLYSIMGKKGSCIRWGRIQARQIANIRRDSMGINNLVKIHGYLASDGCLASNILKYKYDIRFYPDSYTLVRDFLKSFKIVYAIIPHVTKLNNYYRVYIRNKIAYNHLIAIGPFGSLKWRVPYKLLTNKKRKIEWLRCFIDCDGYVSKRGTIQIQSVNRGGIKNIITLLKELGINSTLTKYVRNNKKWNINYILTINKSELFKMKKLFKLLHPNKKMRLSKCAGVA
ncbi:MAG: LAGLIDADG family homing endonuclease [Nanoarchaeota archaeon]